MASPLAGAWELVSDTEEGVAVFTDTHYSFIFQNKNRKPYPADSSDDVAELEAYRTHQSQGGTYWLSGSSLSFGRQICRHPGRSGRPWDFEFTLQDDMTSFASRTWKKVG